MLTCNNAVLMFDKTRVPSRMTQTVISAQCLMQGDVLTTVSRARSTDRVGCVSLSLSTEHVYWPVLTARSDS